MHGRITLVAAVVGALLAWIASFAASAAESFERQPWLQDYEYLKRQLENSYANLAWFASTQSEADLPALDRRARRALESAESGDDAQAAILAFVSGFQDGHFQPVPILQVASATPIPPPNLAIDRLNATDGCAALGYAPARGIAFSLPFEALSGSALESDGIGRVFRAGTVKSQRGTRFGIVRIPRFRPQDAPPTSCVQVWKAEQAARHPIDANTIREKVAIDWFVTLASQLHEFQKESVAAVIVDVGGNTGGNDSGDWAARLFTHRDVHSARLLMAAASSANGYFDEQLESLRDALKEQSSATAAAKVALQTSITAFERRKAKLAERGCNLSWVWQERRPWDPSGCSRLIEAGYSSGQMDYLAAGEFGDRKIAKAIYWAAEVDPFRGAWSGPVYVLTDNKTASSAEMFSAIMQDNQIARIVGMRTEGDGCGFMFDEAPLELPRSHLRFSVPNCVRLRADGSNEVAGIRPDLPVLPTRGEDARARAGRLIEIVDEDIRSRARGPAL